MKYLFSFIFITVFLLVTAGCSDPALVPALSKNMVCVLETSLPDSLTTTEKTFSFEPGEGMLVWWSTDNTPERRELTADEAASGAVTLSVPKGSIMPVLLYYIGTQQAEGTESSSTGDIPHPSGCIWPLSTRIEKAGGFPARMLWRLLTETEPDSGPPAAIRDYCARFNWKRFSEEAAKLDDPWKLEQQVILLAIAAGTFSLQDLKRASP